MAPIPAKRPGQHAAGGRVPPPSAAGPARLISAPRHPASLPISSGGKGAEYLES